MTCWSSIFCGPRALECPLFPTGPGGRTAHPCGSLHGDSGRRTSQTASSGDRGSRVAMESTYPPLAQAWGGFRVSPAGREGACARRGAAGRSCVCRALGAPGSWAQCPARPQGGSTARAARFWAGAPTGAEPASGREESPYRAWGLGRVGGRGWEGAGASRAPGARLAGGPLPQPSWFLGRGAGGAAGQDPRGPPPQSHRSPGYSGAASGGITPDPSQ